MATSNCSEPIRPVPRATPERSPPKCRIHHAPDRARGLRSEHACRDAACSDTSFGYLADVFILEEHRGKGLSKWMMQVLFSHPQLQGFRRWMLATRDAHGLYRQVGFTSLAAPERFMEKSVPDIYRRGHS